MKFTVTMKDPDSVRDSVSDAAKLGLARAQGITDHEREELLEGRIEQLREFTAPWLEYGEYVASPPGDLPPSAPGGVLSVEPARVSVAADDLDAWRIRVAHERRDRIAACEHKRFGQLGDCLGCGAMKSEVFPATDKSTGHPVRNGEQLCSCAAGSKDCVDRGART